MDEQLDHNTQPGASVLPPQQERPRRSSEPSRQKVAAHIAASLGTTEEAAQKRIQDLVWELGRTQAQRLCAEALESEGTQAPIDRFFTLVEAKGVKKERPWLQENRQQHKKGQGISREREVTTLIAEQLGEPEQVVQQIIYRCTRVLGIEQTLVLLQQTHDTEAAGGLMLPDGSRRRTPGGVFFFLVRQAATADQRRQIFPYTGPKPSAAPGTPHSQPSPTREQPHPQPVRPLTWAEREQFFGDYEKGEAKTVKMTLIGRPPAKIVEHEKCIAFVMQQAAKIPALPAGLPIPPLEQVEATRYNVYIASKQWKKVAEAIADPEDTLIIEGFPMLDAQRGTIAVFASNVTTKKLQIAAKQPKV